MCCGVVRFNFGERRALKRSRYKSAKGNTYKNKYNVNSTTINSANRTTIHLVHHDSQKSGGINLPGHFWWHWPAIGRVPDGSLVPSTPLDFLVYVQMRVTKHVDVFERAVVIESTFFKPGWATATTSRGGFTIALVS